MQKTRRNVLAGLGGLTIGGGLLFGTGAFSTVEANRTAEISVSDDASALLTLSGKTESQLINEDGGTLGIDQSNINLDAVTTVDEAITITNNGGQEVEVSIELDEGTAVSNAEAEDIFGLEYSSGDIGQTEGADLIGNTWTFADQDSADVDLVIDTTVIDLSNGDDVLDQMTITAEETP